MRFLALAIGVVGASAVAAYEYEVAIVATNTNQMQFLPAHVAADGRVAGTVMDFDTGRTRASTWLDGELRQFEGFGRTTAALSANDHGQLAGYAELEGQLPIPSYWEADGTFRPLLVPFFGDALVITNDRTIFGQAFIGRGRVFLWQNGRLEILPVLGRGPGFRAVDMNESKTAVGYELSREGGFVAGWMWTRKRGTFEIPVAPVDVNNKGTVLGWSGGRPYRLWRDGQIRDLPRGGFPYDSRAVALNDHETVIGWTTFDGDDSYAVIWKTPTSDPVLLDSLIDPALRLSVAGVVSINNAGQILGHAKGEDGGQYTVRLDPRR